MTHHEKNGKNTFYCMTLSPGVEKVSIYENIAQLLGVKAHGEPSSLCSYRRGFVNGHTVKIEHKVHKRFENAYSCF